jgi:hypothetical protein
MMTTVSDIALLTSVLPILFEIAERLAGDSEDAKAAQNAINKDSPLDDCFHGTVFLKLSEIQTSLWDWSESKYKTSAAAQAPVQSLLGALEDTVAGVFQHQQSAYPGLNQIKDIAGSATALSSDVETQIKSCFFCPRPEVRARLVRAVSDCAEALDTSSFTSAIRDIAQGEELLLPIERLCDGAVKIEAAIKQGLNCIPCGCQHEAVFSFATPCHDREAFGNCLMSFRRDRSMHTWISARVAFKQMHGTSGSRSGVPLCEVLLNGSTETHLESLGDGFIDIATKKQPCKTSVVSLTSFNSWIANGQSNGYVNDSEQHRLLLTLLLSYAYLYLGGSSWWPNARVDAGLWFANHLDPKIIRPFLQFSTAQEHRTGFVEKLINQARPSLPAFGKLILEIWLGRPITWGDEDMLGAEKDCQRSALGPHIYRVAKSCFEADSILKGEGSLRDDVLMRETFISNVVKTLQYMSRLAGLAPQQIVKLLETQMRTDSRMNQGTDITEPATCEDLPVSNTPTSEQNGAEPESNATSISSAKAWLNRFGTFRRDLFLQVQNDTAVKPLKIAVIDTGAWFDKKTLVKQYDNRVAGFWPCTAAEEAKAPVCMQSDLDGHGTSVASVLLDIDQNCHVYVYKAFNKKDEQQGEDLADRVQADVLEVSDF